MLSSSHRDTQEDTHTLSHTHTHTDAWRGGLFRSCCPQQFLRGFLLLGLWVRLFWALVRSSGWERSFVFGQITLPSRHWDLEACVCVCVCVYQCVHGSLFFVREHHVACWPRAALCCPAIPSCLWSPRSWISPQISQECLSPLLPLLTETLKLEGSKLVWRCRSVAVLWLCDGRCLRTTTKWCHTQILDPE